jgi:hypothetical protein
MGYLPSEKIRPVEKYEDFSGRSHCNGLPAQWKNIRIFQDGHIVMGYQNIKTFQGMT